MRKLFHVKHCKTNNVVCSQITKNCKNIMKNEIYKNDVNMLIDEFSKLYNDAIYLKKIVNIYFENNIAHDEIKIFFENDDDIYLIAFYKNKKIINYVIFNFDFLTIDDFDCETIEQCIIEFFN
jgi:hypothetical protein